MSEISLRWIDSDALDQVMQIDRTEMVDALYTQSGSRILLKSTEPTIAQWPAGAEIVEFCRGHMRDGAQALGAFDGEALIGVGIMTPNVQPRVAQLAFLHVSEGYRRRGIAVRLLAALKQRVEQSGHQSIYVTATPTKSAVGFYLRAGFSPTDTPIPHLLALEPEDIHMIAAL